MLKTSLYRSSLSLLIVEPATVARTVYYFWTQIKEALTSGAIIVNLGSQLKWAAIVFAVIFTLNSLTLIYYIWKISSLKKQEAKIKGQICQLEKEMF